MERAALVCIHGFRKLIGDYLRHLDLLQFSLHLLHYIFSYLQKKRKRKGKGKLIDLQSFNECWQYENIRKYIYNRYVIYE